MLASHALALVGVPMRRVIRVVQDQRDARYGLLRGYFHGADDDNADELRARAAAQRHAAAERRARRPARSASWRCTACGVRWCRCGAPTARSLQPDDDAVLAAGDTLVLSGLPEPLALAEEKLLTPAEPRAGGGDGAGAASSGDRRLLRAGWRACASPSRRRRRAAARARAPASAAPALPGAGRAAPRRRTASSPRPWPCAACRRTGPARRPPSRRAGSRSCCCRAGRRDVDLQLPWARKYIVRSASPCLISRSPARIS